MSSTHSTAERNDVHPLRCRHCETSLHVCAFCDEDGCRVAMCYPCVRVAVRQATRQPHDHGG